MEGVNFPPTLNPCQFCDIAPCVGCRDAKKEGPGIMDDGNLCPQGMKIFWQRRNGDLARSCVDRPEFYMPERFKKARLADAAANEPKHPERAWQARARGSLNDWVVAAIHQKADRMLNVVIKGKISGIGKTYIAAAIANDLLDGGISAVFVEVRNLLGMIHRAQFRKDENSGGRMTVDDILDTVKKCEVLVLDEVKVVAVTPYQQEILWDIVNWRYQNLKSTIITTQCSSQDLTPSPEWNRLIRRIAEKDACLAINIDADPKPRGANREPARKDLN